MHLYLKKIRNCLIHTCIYHQLLGLVYIHQSLYELEDSVMLITKRFSF